MNFRYLIEVLLENSTIHTTTMAYLAPVPALNHCHNNCGPVEVEGAAKEEITCPCGFGYYDRNGDFVPGSLVREGTKPTRAEYIAHVEATTPMQTTSSSQPSDHDQTASD